MRFYLSAVLLSLTLRAYAESPCDVRPGTTMGIRVMEFASGNVVHSKIPLRESSPEALLEEMLNLQDMGVCEERIISRKCVLKFQKLRNTNYVVLLRGSEKWNAWGLKSKDDAQKYVKGLKRYGFCT
jgi:hypothetical protein